MSLQDINAGSLQRIADATEKMALRHTDLMRERDNYERWYREECARSNQILKQLAAAKGVATKLKRQIAAMKASSP